MGFFISAKKDHWDFDRGCVESVDNSVDILTILSVPNHEHGISLHLFTSLISFSSFLRLSIYLIFTSTAG